MISTIDIILDTFKDDAEYIRLSHPHSNIYESWMLMAELLDPAKSYDYQEKMRGLWVFRDRNSIEYFVRLTYQPTTTPFYEFKMGWFDEGGKPQYHQKTKGEIEIDGFRSDTIAKIYRDEVIPMFLSSEYSGEMHVIPLKEDPARYGFFLRMVKKFPIPNTDIIEDKYKLVIVKKRGFKPKGEEVNNPYA